MKCRKLQATPLSLLLASCLVLGGLLLLAACSGGSAGGGSTGGQPTTPAKANEPAAQPPAGKTVAPSAKVSLDPCSLLTKQEVEAAVGKTVLDPKPEATGPLVACQYNDPEFPVFNVVSLVVFVGTDAKEAKDLFEMGKRNSGGAPAVAGLGDDGYWLDMLHTLDVLKGRYDISIDVTADAKDPQGAAKSLAAKVLGRLP